MRIPAILAGASYLLGGDQHAFEVPTGAVSNDTHPWMDQWRNVEDRVALLQGNLTLKEKLQFVEGAAALENHGVGAAINPCIGLIKVAKRLYVIMQNSANDRGIPNLCMGDGPSGVSNGLGNVTTFPAPIVVSSSWDTDLMYRYAKAIAKEHRDKGHNVVLTPTMNIQRTPLWGRNAESLSEDPYLTAQMAIANVRGTQSEDVLACPKHFAETNRFGHYPNWSAANVVVSNRTLQELYFPGFKAVVQNANPGSVMTAYNKINGEHASENYAALGDLFSWGFDDAFTVTDWYFGHRSTLDAALAGQTMSMPGGKSDFGFDDFYSRSNLMSALDKELLSMERLDDMVRRVITPMFAHGLVDDVSLGHVMNDARSSEHHQLAVEAVEAGSILLKNENNTLPFGPSVKKIAVIGYGGGDGALVTERYGGFVGSPNLNETLVTPLQGLTARAGSDVLITYAKGYTGLGEYGDLPKECFPEGMRIKVFESPEWLGTPLIDSTLSNHTAALKLDLDATLPKGVSALYEGTLRPKQTGIHQFSMYAGGFAKLFIDGEEVAWIRKEDFVNYAYAKHLLSADFSTGQVHLAEGKAVRFELHYSSAPAITSIGVDLTWIEPMEQAVLLTDARRAAAFADASIVFVGNVLSEGGDGTTLALSETHNKLVEEVANAGRRVVVVAQTNNPCLMPWIDDVDAVLLQWYAGEGVGTALARILFGDVSPSGKLAMTFPASDSQGPTALQRRFPGPEGDRLSDSANVYYDEGLLVGYKWYDAHKLEPLFPFGHGLSYTFFKVSMLNHWLLPSGDVHFAFTIQNVGQRQGKEVVQLYVSYPDEADEPPKQLKRFEKVSLESGASATVEFEVSKNDLQYWADARGWTFAPGEYIFHIGTSSRDIAHSLSIAL